MADPDTAHPLTQQQVDFFHNEGYLHVQNVLTDDDLQPAIDEFTGEVDQRARKFVERGELSRTYEEEGFETRLARISQETDKIAISMWNGSLHGPALFRLISSRRLLDVAEQLCGPELIASGIYRLRPKLPDHGYSVVPWHQDSGYFEPYCDKSLIVSVWIPFVDATRENGCLWVIPKSHRVGLVNHSIDQSGHYLKIDDEDLPGEEPLCCPVPKGDVLLLTNMTAHASYQNKSNVVRWSMDLRYQSASLPTNAQITHLPGETVASVETGIPGACYPPEADVLVRSKQRPREVITTPEQFEKARAAHLGHEIPDRWNVGRRPPNVSIQ